MDNVVWTSWSACTVFILSFCESSIKKLEQEKFKKGMNCPTAHQPEWFLSWSLLTVTARAGQKINTPNTTSKIVRTETKVGELFSAAKHYSVFFSG